MNSYELLEGFPFRQISDPSRIINLNSVARGLLEMFYLCKETEQSAVVLTWPSRVENIAILHALAVLHQIVMTPRGESKPETVPLITYFWPWKRTTDIVQKRLLVDRTEFVKNNLKFVVEWQAGVEYAFHIALNCVNELNPSMSVTHTQGHRSILQNHPELVHPTLFELTIQAVFQPGYVKNHPIAKDNFLIKAQKYISQYSMTSDSNLFQIESAPFFMLNIPEYCTNRDLCRGDLFAARRPNIVLVDLTGVDSRLGKNWQKHVAAFLSILVSAFSGNDDDIPPVLAIADDPIVFYKARYGLLADYEKKRRNRRRISCYSFLNVIQSLFDNKQKVDESCPVPSVRVVPFAEEMADVFVAGQELRTKAKKLGSEELAEQIDILNHTMRNVVNMPGGMDDYMEFLQEYCDQSGRDISTVAIKPLQEWTKTKELVEQGDAGAERIEAEEHLKKTRAIIDGLKTATPLQARLDGLYEKLSNSQKQSHALVFPSKPMKAFAEWMLLKRSKQDDSVNGNGEIEFALFDSRQALDLSTTLLNDFESVYFILPRQKYLSHLLAQRDIPTNITFICDGGTVLSLMRYVDILSKVPGLGAIKPRLSKIQEALEAAAASRINVLGELDEIRLMANVLIYNLRELEPGQYHGHPVIISTEEGVNISAYEGSDILKYQEDNDLQPFSKETVSHLRPGDRCFVITSEFLDAASDKINITAMATKTLRDYHARVVERVNAIRGWSLKDKAEVIQRKMKDEAGGRDIGEAESVNNIVRWINVESLLEAPRELVKPQAPKYLKIFKLFMKALGVLDGETDWYWAAAIQSTRKVRIRAGLDRNRVFYKLLLDPTSVEQFFQGNKEDLLNLIDIACRNVFTITEIVKEHVDEHLEH